MTPHEPTGKDTTVRALTDDEVLRIRKRIERLLDECGGVQTTLANKIQERVSGFRQQTISSTLSGKPVGLKVARELAEYLGLTIDEILSPPIYVIETLVSERPKVWSRTTVAAVKAMAGVSSLSRERAEQLLDDTEEALRPVMAGVKKTHR